MCFSKHFLTFVMTAMVRIQNFGSTIFMSPPETICRPLLVKSSLSVPRWALQPDLNQVVGPILTWILPLSHRLAPDVFALWERILSVLVSQCWLTWSIGESWGIYFPTEPTTLGLVMQISSFHTNHHEWPLIKYCRYYQFASKTTHTVSAWERNLFSYSSFLIQYLSSKNSIC